LRPAIGQKFLLTIFGAVCAFLFWGIRAAAQENGDNDRHNRVDANSLRNLIGQQAGGLNNLRVPATDVEIPLPRQADGTVNPRYRTTEAKRYLGKLLFHDPVRTARVNINQGQPVDLPAGTAFGGTVSASEPNIQAIVNATRQTGSCGSRHIGEAASKAGQLLNFNTGGEGRGYTDEHGNFVPRRRPQSVLTKLRNAPMFPGGALVDGLPTLTDVDLVGGQQVVTTPANFYHQPPPNALIETGRLDALDSVARQSPSLIGFAFNNRLLLGGLGGEAQSTPGSLNPFNDPAQENLTLLLLDAHRMLNFQSAELLKIPAFVKRFRCKLPGRQTGRVEVHADHSQQSVQGATAPRRSDHFMRPLVSPISAVVRTCRGVGGRTWCRGRCQLHLALGAGECT
jgi:hypothetical protein